MGAQRAVEVKWPEVAPEEGSFVPVTWTGSKKISGKAGIGHDRKEGTIGECAGVVSAKGVSRLFVVQTYDLVGLVYLEFLKR